MIDLRRHIPPVALSWDDETPGALWRVVDGTLVFADVSGFTALTERLSLRGRIGAEEIVETLNRVFGPMLRIAAARGGELLKFGGDALLFLFGGDDHVGQACDAAVEMRSGLRQAAAVPTSVGRLRLSMSVGVHSGDIHLFLVGTPTRELLILGPGATRTAEAEKAAQAGQIVVSAATAARLTRGSTRPREDGQLLLRRRGPHSSPPGAVPLPSVDPVTLRTLFPQALGEYLAPAVPDPEHRLAAISFIRFSGTDALLAGAGPDALAKALDETVSMVQRALLPEGVTLLGTDIDSDGGKFFLASGIPVAFDDNEGRMLRALRRIADTPGPLSLQLGANRGHVFVAEIGIAERAAYSGMGDTTNTAARIMSKAPAGRLYVHPAVLEHSRTRFAVTPAGPFPMKGKVLPMLVYDVGEELGTREEPTPGTRLPFLGREEELKAVCDGLADGLSGAGSIMTITGASGTGKTRLAREALQETAFEHAIIFRAEPYGSASAYRMLRDPLREILGIERGDQQTMGRALLAAVERIAPELISLAPLLADIAQVDVPSTPEVDQIDSRYRPDRVADAFVRLLGRARPGRVVVVVEEAHWADAASARLLDRLAAESAGRPWAILALRRPDPGGFDPESGIRVHLAPLPATVIERLVIAATEATPLRPHEIAAIVNRAEGNPLFVDEVTRVAGAGSMEALPESVGAALTAQIDALHPRVRRILRYCAVLGRSFRTEVLRIVLATDELDLETGDLDALSAFLEPDGEHRMRFRNSLVRDAAYDSIAYRIKARLHQTAGETLERISTDLDVDATTLALHFWRANDVTRTWTYARRAGDMARKAGANADAAEMYERALDVSRRVPGISDTDRAQLSTSLGEVRELAGVLDGSVDAYRKAIALSAHPVARAQILAKRARVHERAGSLQTALRVVTQARSELALVPASTADEVSVQLDALVAMVRIRQEKLEEGRAWALRTVAAARRVGDDDTLASTLLILGAAEAQLGHDRVSKHFLEALEVFQRHGDRTGESAARANLGVFAFYAGHWDEAVEWYASSRRVALEAGNHFGAAETELNLAEILIMQGKLDEAEQALQDAARVLTASGIEYMAAYGGTLQSRVHLARGEYAKAEQSAAHSVERFRAMGSWSTALDASLVQAEAMIGQSRAAEALTVVDEAVRAARGEDQALAARIHLVRGRALRSLGRKGEAGEVVETGLTVAREQQLPYEEAFLLRERSALAVANGHAETADEDAGRATRLLSELGART